MRAFVVWEPVIWSDLAPPATGVLARISDRRAAQYWDPEHLLSKGLLQAMRTAGTSRRADEPYSIDPSEEAEIVWDCVAIYPPGALWQDAPPQPEYIDCPVVEVIDEARGFLLSSASRAR